MAEKSAELNKYTKQRKLVRTTKSVTVATPYWTSGAQFSISDTKTGYTPLMVTVRNNYASKVMQSIESESFGNGTISVSGYCGFLENTTVNVSYTMEVLWQENE